MYNSSVGIQRVAAIFSPNGVHIHDFSLGITGLDIRLAPSYFKTYEVDKETPVLLTETLFSKISKFFNTSEMVDIDIGEIDGEEKIVVRGVNENYEEPLLAVPKQEMLKFIQSDIGYLPEVCFDEKKNFSEKVNFVGLLQVSELQKFPETELYAISTTEKGIVLGTLRDTGTYTRLAGIKDKKKFDQVTIHVLSDYFNRMSKNFAVDSDIWLIIGHFSPETNSGPDSIMFTQYTPEISSTMLLTTSNEE